MSTADVYEQYRPLMFSIAYRMLGTASEAEDVVQEAFLRYHRAESGENAGNGISSPKAYLSAVTTRLCIDYLRSARARREAYLGEWLPEPLLTDDSAPDPAGLAEQADSLSMAFLLHDVFGYDYDEISAIVKKSPDNCRQLALRARRHVNEQKPRFEASRSKREELATRFFSAVGSGDMDGLVSMLAADVVVYGDSGGIPPSWPRPIVGRDPVSRLLVGIANQMQQIGVTIQLAEFNGQAGARLVGPDGRLISVFVLDIADGQVQTVRSVINPDKLQHLGPLADVQALRHHLRPPA